VDVAFLTETDWKYEGSGAAEGKGGRTHTFGIRNPASRLRGAAAYSLPGIVLKSGKPVLGEEPKRDSAPRNNPKKISK
jgi:hypothetical protein